MTALILEDEPIAAKRLTRMLKELNLSIQVLATFDSVKDTADYLIGVPMPDILFLDIQVSDGLSFELFDVMNIQSSVIFTTAYDGYAVEAFRKNALDYLLKPIKQSELQEAVEKAQRISELQSLSIREAFSEYKSRFLVRFGAKLHVIEAKDIAYIYSENKISYFVKHNGNRIASDLNLRDIMNSLNPEVFFRANRQFVIHRDAIKEMLTYSKSRINLRLIPPFDSDIIISTERTREFKKWLRS